jgi:ureidoacrylate peracid hydrolase
MAASLEERFGPDSCALLVVDMQNDFCHSEGFLARRGIDLGPTQAMAATLVDLIEVAREAGLPVIYTVNAHDEWTDSQTWTRRHKAAGATLCRPGSWGAAFYAVSPRDDERVIAKHRYDAFLGTDLDLVLRTRGIRTLILTGVATNVCVETTAREAYCRDYHVVLVDDCLAAATPEEHRTTLATLERYFDVVIARAADIASLCRRSRPGKTQALAS